jgi:hypothetical protein
MQVEFRSIAGNSGIDYRAQKITKGRNGENLDRTIQGYQADIAGPQWTGSLYNWGKAGAQPGQFVVVTGMQQQTRGAAELVERETLDSVGYYRHGDWNKFEVIARGTHIIQRLNGYPVAEFIDNSSLSRREGLLGLQVHSGNRPFHNEFRKVALKRLNNRYGPAKVIFNGENLDGWRHAAPSAKEIWHVRQGALICEGLPPREKAGPDGLPAPGPLWIQTKGDYGDFVLRFQYRQIGGWTGGVILRARRQGDDPAGVWVCGPTGHYSEIWTVDVPNERIDQGRQRPMRTMPDGFWNECEIVLADGRLSVEVNAVVRTAASVPASQRGAIAFNAGFGPVEYRNIVAIPIVSD